MILIAASMKKTLQHFAFVVQYVLVPTILRPSRSMPKLLGVHGAGLLRRTPLEVQSLELIVFIG